MGEDNKFQNAKVWVDGQELGEVTEIKCVGDNNIKEPFQINLSKTIKGKFYIKNTSELRKLLNKIFEVVRLYRILNRTRKPRVKKKLLKRIIKCKYY